MKINQRITRKYTHPGAPNGSVPQNSLCYAKSDNISKKMQLYIQIHKFTIKIDTISINLLFECVKVVEFNFNSHVFLVMYQDLRFVNQDACFLNQEERRQFLISSVSERD